MTGRCPTARLLDARRAAVGDGRLGPWQITDLRAEEYALNHDGQALPAVAPIAALYVQTDGCYFGIPGVDPWDEARDARTYAGPHPVVAHPPCERWGRYWGGSPTTWPRLVKGDDGGCFAAALASVRRWGGIIEHPEGSHAWRAYGLIPPPRAGGWVRADAIHGHDGWTCCVEQGAYGHQARKATWLYAHGVHLPELRWGRAKGDFLRMEDGFHSAAERARAVKTGICQRLSKRQRAATPIEFRDLLLGIARSRRAPSALARHLGLTPDDTTDDNGQGLQSLAAPLAPCAAGEGG